MPKTWNVFLAVDLGRKRTGEVTHTARWVTRGLGTDLYRSKPCTTDEEARRLAMRWLAKNPNCTDTTRRAS